MAFKSPLFFKIVLFDESGKNSKFQMDIVYRKKYMTSIEVLFNA